MKLLVRVRTGTGVECLERLIDEKDEGAVERRLINDPSMLRFGWSIGPVPEEVLPGEMLRLLDTIVWRA